MNRAAPVTESTAIEPSPTARNETGAVGASASLGTAVVALKARDNLTNWPRVAFVWAVIAATIAGGLWLEAAIIAHNLSLWWLAPYLVVSTFILGASQHQLGGIIHEGTHFLLFENKKLNELASDWLAAFPIYTSTYQFRVHHLAHHQFVNDPERDPDIAQLKDSGHWLDFPVAHIDVLRKLLKQFWLPNIARFTLVRARYSAVGHDENPYIEKDDVRSKLPVRAGIVFAVVVPITVSTLLKVSTATVAWALLIGSYLAVVAYFALLPDKDFPQTRLQPVISHRATVIGRMTFLFVLYAAFTVYDAPNAGNGTAWAYDHYGLYWVLPLFTTFPLFMMIRQWVQHGNADRGRYTNTRVFFAGPLLRYAVFPWGMDYHLPHHMMASVPHYNLKRLHDLLKGDPQYAEKGVEVEGYHGDSDAATRRPTILSVLGAKYAPSGREKTYVDNATLEYADVKDAAAIAREAEVSSRR